MPEILGKLKKYYKKAALFCGLFLVVFAAAFYIANLDFNSIRNRYSSENLPASNLNEELKKRLGSTTLAMESYDGWARRYKLPVSNNGFDADPDKDNLPNYLEYVHGTNPLKADSDGDGYSDQQEITNGYDPDAPGDEKPLVEITLSKINVIAPMVWSKSEKEENMLKDLESGISHYAKTASPGQNGNAIISGHSSNYFWAKGDYNYIFKNLNNLERGDVVIVSVLQNNGRLIIYRYKVSDKFVAAPDDQKIFANTKNPSLTLSTCWPLGTKFRRLIVKAELEK